MKKLLFIFGVLLLISCSPDKVEIDINEREKCTTVELVNLAKADTNIYHVVVKDDVVYVLNNDYIVVKKLENTSGLVSTLLIILWIVVISFILAIII